MDHHVDELREARHQPVLHHVRGRVRILERRPAVEPDVQIHEDVIG